MPYIPGLGPGGAFGSAPVQPGPPVTIGGTIVSVSYTGVINNSGIQLYLPKFQSMPTGWNDIDDYSESLQPGAQEITRTFIGPWTARTAFAQWALGYSTNVPAGSGGQIRRTIPIQHPVMPWLYAVKCEAVGKGAIVQDPTMIVRSADGVILLDSNGLPMYIPFLAYVDGGNFTEGKAVVKVTYADLPYEVYPDEVMDANGLNERCRFVERQEEYSLQALPLNTQRLTFAEGPTTPPVKGQLVGPSTISIFTQSIILKWHQVPDIDETALQACANKVNDAIFDPPYTVNTLVPPGPQTISPSGAGYPAGTLLFATFRKHRTPRDMAGRVSFIGEFGFAYRPQGWNKFPDSLGNFWLATSNGQPTGDPCHKSADFNTLFRMPFPRKYQADG